MTSETEATVREIVKDKLKFSAPGLSECTRTAIARSIAMSASAALASTAGAGAGDWRPIETAPPDLEVEVRIGAMTFLAKLVPGAAINTDETPCDQWQATREGEHPPCWSDGACWENNADCETSMSVEAWRPVSAVAGSGARGHEPDLIRMLSDDNARMRHAGTALSEAALYVVREYDGCHRLSLAVADWAKAIADEGGRGERHASPAVPASPRSGAGAVSVPPPGSEERDFWLEAAVQHGFEETTGGEHLPEYDPPAYFATADEVLALMASARQQGREDVPALSQGGGAGRSERAVEIRELSEKATQGPWVYRPDRYDDWGFIRAPRSTADMPGEVVAVSRGEGSDTHDAHRTAGTDPYEHNGRFIVALENDYRSGELVHRSEIAGRSEKGEGEEEGRVPSGTGSHPTGEAATASSSPSDIDPSRGWIPYEHKDYDPRPDVDWTGYSHEEASSGPAIACEDYTGEPLFLVWWSDFGQGVSRITAWRPLPAELAPPAPDIVAQAIKARRAKTQGGFVEDESAVHAVDAPCHWGGGNDIIWCSTCGAEYAYAKGEERPPCPRSPAPAQSPSTSDREG